MKPGGTGAVSPRNPKSLNLSLRWSVEIQAQHRPDRLKKPRTELVRDRSVRPRSKSVETDRIDRFCAENRGDAKKDIPRGIYFGVSVGALKEH